MANPLAVANVQVITLRCSLMAYPVFWLLSSFRDAQRPGRERVPRPNSVLHFHLCLPSRARQRWDNLSPRHGRDKGPIDLSSIKAGENPPHEVNVIIQIPQGGAPVKYEVDKKSGAMFVDRFLHTAMFYPANYGFIPHTLSEDGDPIDCMVIAPTPVAPGAVVRARPIGALLMEDEKGIDEKIIAVPIDKL